MEQRRWRIEPGPSERLDRVLVGVWPDLSRARLQALIEEGRLTVDGVVARASQKTLHGQEIVLDVPDVVSWNVEAEDLPLDILYDDADIVVVNKAAGMVVHPSAGHRSGTLVNALLARVRDLSGIGGVERPGIVHRLDGGTSGVLVVAKNDVAHRALSSLFAAHDLDRLYLAVVHKVPLHDAGTFRSSLGRDPDDRLKIASRDDGRPAVTHWKLCSKADRLALLACRLETGRTHQIRVHLSEAGHPIVGDPTYNRRDCTPPAAVRVAAEALTHPLLHAQTLGFAHPRTGAPMSWTVPPPSDFLAFCAVAGLTVP